METWLDGKILNNEFGLDNYTIFRCDRSIHITSTRTRRGGVLIAVKNSLRSSKVVVTSRNVEQLFVVIHHSAGCTIAGAIYLPPSFSTALYKTHCNSIFEVLNLYSNSRIYICGDYNFPCIDWTYQDSVLSYSTSHNASSNEVTFADLLLQTFNYYDSYQANSIPNQYDNILDLFFSNDRTVNVARSVDTLLSCDNYHPALYISIHPVNASSPARGYITSLILTVTIIVESVIT